MIKASKHLANSGHVFHPMHIAYARKIHNEIEGKRWMQLGDMLSQISNEDKEKIHYAFYDLYGYDYDLKIRSLIGDYNELRKFGLAG